MSLLRPGHADSKARKHIRLAAIAVVTIFCIGAGTIGAYCGLLQLRGNVHVVVENQLYRSAQLDKVTLEKLIREHGIKSILNLLGSSPDKAWYVDEIAVAKTLGVEHHDYGISASEVVSAGKLDDIVKILRHAPKPILIHCKNGADRSGLVAAVYLTEIKGVTPDEATGQLSLYYGHFPWLTSTTGAMDESFREYERRNFSPSSVSNVNR